MSFGLKAQLFFDRALNYLQLTSPSGLADRLINRELPKAKDPLAGAAVLLRIEEALTRAAANPRSRGLGEKTYTQLSRNLLQRTENTPYAQLGADVVANTLPAMHTLETSSVSVDLAKEVLGAANVKLSAQDGFFCAQFALSPEDGERKRVLVTFPKDNEPKLAYRVHTGPLSVFPLIVHGVGSFKQYEDTAKILQEADEIAGSVEASRKFNMTAGQDFSAAVASYAQGTSSWATAMKGVGRPTF